MDATQPAQQLHEPEHESLRGNQVGKLLNHKSLLLSFMLQKGILSLFIAIASEFFNEYWGNINTFYLVQANDDQLVGLFWIVTCLLLLPFGTILNVFWHHQIFVLLFSSVF
jgi:hypothetical protein